MRGLFALCSLLFVLAVSATAFAAEITPTFDQFDGQLEDGQLTVVYEVESESWKALQTHGITPHLNLYVGKKKGKSKFLDTKELPGKKGSFTFAKKVKVANGDTIEIQIHGSGGKNKIDGWKYRNQTGKKLSFELRNGVLIAAGDGGTAEPQPQPTSAPQVPANWRTDVVNACDKYAYVSSEKGECVGFAVKLDPRWAADTVQACSKYGYVRSQMNECIEKAAEHKKFDPAKTAKACKENVYVSSEFLDCMEVTADFKAPPEKMLPACKASVYVSSERMDCFEKVSALDASAESLVRACKGRDWEECLANATR